MPCNIVPVRRGFWAWLLRRTGLAAITMPWRTVYVRKSEAHRAGLIRHELVHVEQIERDGAVLFTARYLWWLIRYGYWANPYEVEAYAREPATD